ncbi:MAG: tetratricopeptide repeat protein [Verrucomicrobia bacterium]|nr:tetratricopeptide repeat protein [Verrucomicrobiota bacterium]
MSLSRFHSIAIGILIATGVLLYGHTLPFPFVFDDHIYLVGNPLVKDAGSFTFNGDFLAFATYPRKLGLDPDLATNFILRPFAYLTFYINYALGGMNPRGFRAVNIAIHCANAALLFLLLSHLLRRSGKAGSLPSSSAGFIAFASALLFLAHPLQTESVTYIVQRFTSLGTFFYLFTILAYLLSNVSEKTYLLSESSRNRTAARAFRRASVAGLVVGMLTKEFLFTAPFMLVMLDWLVMGTGLKVACRRALPHFLCLPIIPALIVLTSWAQHSGNASLAAALNITNPAGVSPYHYALTQLSVVLTYLRLILAPVGLNMDWDYPLSTSLLQGRVLVSAALIAGIIAGAWLWYRRRQEDVRVSLFFGSILWYFLALAIDSSVVPLPDLLSEHRSYLPSIGALTALACCADLLRTRFDHRWSARYVVPAGIALWILALGAATFARNDVWSSEISMWRDVTTKSPKKLRAWFNLGTAYYEHKQPQEAIACFQRVIQHEPAAVATYRNLAKVLYWSGRFREALQVSQAGLRYAPHDHEIHCDMGVAYAGLGDTAKSIQLLRSSIAINPRYRPAHLSLGTIYARQQQYGKALDHWRIAASLPPADPQLNLAITRIESLAHPPRAVP